ncbi:hypothetical protein [Collimonas humicola]|nr:hypothetical protein [Collimonas humicola]
MSEILLIVIGASGVAISIFANLTFARRSGSAEVPPAVDGSKQGDP